MSYKPKTFFIDIDGTILYQQDFDAMNNAMSDDDIESLTKPFKAAVDRINEWFMRGDCIVITTARPEHLLEFTVRQLAIAGIPYTSLVMEIGRSTRILINNLSENDPTETRAQAYEVYKNDENAFNLIDE